MSISTDLKVERSKGHLDLRASVNCSPCRQLTKLTLLLTYFSLDCTDPAMMFKSPCYVYQSDVPST